MLLILMGKLPRKEKRVKAGEPNIKNLELMMTL